MSKVCFSLYIQYKQKLSHIHLSTHLSLLICCTHLSLFIINRKGGKKGKVQSHMHMFTRRNTSHYYQSNSDEKFGLRRPSLLVLNDHSRIQTNVQQYQQEHSNQLPWFWFPRPRCQLWTWESPPVSRTCQLPASQIQRQTGANWAMSYNQSIRPSQLHKCTSPGWGPAWGSASRRWGRPSPTAGSAATAWTTTTPPRSCGYQSPQPTNISELSNSTRRNRRSGSQTLTWSPPRGVPARPRRGRGPRRRAPRR